VRFIIYGAGAVGGVVGAGLVRHDHEVVLIARGSHGEVIRSDGLHVATPDGTFTVRPSVVSHPTEIEFRDDDVVILAVKSQDTAAALTSLSIAAPPSTTIVCAQNGVENERLALRFFSEVYGVCVVGNTFHLAPGMVGTETSPVYGSLDFGRYPSGIDELGERVVTALTEAGWLVLPRDDIMRWKYTKLLRNLVLAIQALCGPSMRQGAFFDLARREGEQCLEAAGIEFVSNEEWSAARALGPAVVPPPGGLTVGGSSWQSLARGTGSIESAYLNGEIVLLGRQLGVAVPVNELLYDLGVAAAATGQKPGSMSEQNLFDLLAQRVGG
jgi:2-dehydropantoate 2-reductase